MAKYYKNQLITNIIQKNTLITLVGGAIYYLKRYNKMILQKIEIINLK